ncbi:MAG: poly-beta-1,6-N-acetyl-D-glucosamine N-deacetylase PgaB [Methylococcaceae bacterium]|nr:poly-beta-1,6-N-acetyl-D-glucosamine N-deacetylase PgaB [Methylococcaceae bacterium]
MLSLFAADGLAADRFIVLSYHDVRDVVERDARAGQTAVGTERLAAHFQWLKDHDYHVVSVDQVLAAHAGKHPLPERAVLLSFDDGYEGVYSKAFPLLRRYGYSAMVALVGCWLDGTCPVGDGSRPADGLMTLTQLRELIDSGLVEMASHSYDLHRGLLGNPQGNEQPAGVTRRYDAAGRQYEADASYLARIRADMKRSSDVMWRMLHVRPRAIVWPYGETNTPLVEAARDAGMTMSMVLRDGDNAVADLSAVRRMLVTDNPDVEDFARMVTTQRVGDRPLHVVHVDMDYLYDPDPAQTERNIGALLDRIQGMRVNTVYLQAFADPDGDGNAEALYFPNRHLPVRADLFNRVAWQLLTRVRVKVYAWMPVLAFRLDVPDGWFVHEWRNGERKLAGHIYKRLSPFNRDARRMVGEIYEDLAKHCSFNGVLFHDDAILSDYEDVSPAGMDWLRRTGQSSRIERLRATPAARLDWARHKTAALIRWTDYLTERVRYYRPDIKTARNYYALPLLQPDSEEWYAQSLESALAGYDYVAVEAMPFMEKADDPQSWLGELVRQVARRPGGLAKTVFELQTADWEKRTPVPMEVFLDQLKWVQRQGAVHVGYYPDDVFLDHPRQEDMERVFALPRFP